MTRIWNANEDACLREHYRQRGCAWVERALGRTAASVQKRAARLGISTSYRPGMWTTADDAALKRLYEEGHTGREIARQLGRHHRTVHEHRVRLGIPLNWSEERNSERLRELSIRSGQRVRFVEAQKDRHNKFARDCGWPEGLTPRQVTILNLLWERGPLTRREIVDALGMKWRGPKQTLAFHRPGRASYLGHLTSLGLVVRLRVPGEKYHAYTLGLAVEPRRTA